MIRFQFLFALYFLGCTFAIQAQNSAAEELVQVNFPEKIVDGNNSLLWKIEGDSLAGISYLYGTMHLPNSKVLGLFDSVGNVIGRCDAVAVELVLNPKDAFSMLPNMMMKDTSLKELYTQSEYSRVRAVLREKLGPLSFVANKIKPIFLSTLIEEEMYVSDADVVLDQYIQDLGAAQNKKIIGIETVDEQMAAIDVLSLKDQADLFLEYIDGMNEADSLSQVLFKTYISQDLDGMNSVYGDEDMPEELNESMVIKRNFVMAERTLAMMKEKTVYIAVGALHLVGETGLIELFRKEGLTVTATRR